MSGFTVVSFVDALDASCRFLEDIFVVVCMLRSDGIDCVLVFLEQFAHAVGLVQWVELFLGHLFELFDEFDDVVVLVLARII